MSHQLDPSHDRHRPSSMPHTYPDPCPLCPTPTCAPHSNQFYTHMRALVLNILHGAIVGELPELARPIPGGPRINTHLHASRKQGCDAQQGYDCPGAKY